MITRLLAQAIVPRILMVRTTPQGIRQGDNTPQSHISHLSVTPHPWLRPTPGTPHPWLPPTPGTPHPWLPPTPGTPHPWLPPTPGTPLPLNSSHYNICSDSKAVWSLCLPWTTCSLCTSGDSIERRPPIHSSNWKEIIMTIFIAALRP